jgi:hypothetical protein
MDNLTQRPMAASGRIYRNRFPSVVEVKESAERLERRMADRVADGGTDRYNEPNALKAREFADEVESILEFETIRRDAHTFYIYDDEHPYVFGYVGYGMFRKSNNDVTYCVSSPHIENFKYALDDSLYRTKLTINHKIAIQTASRYICKPTLQALAGEFSGEVRRAITDEVNPVKDNLRITKDKISYIPDSLQNMTGLIGELKHLLDINHKFVSAEFGELVRALFEQREEYAETDVPVDMFFVRVFDSRKHRVQTFEVCAIDNIRRDAPTYYKDVSTFTADTLPKHIMEKLAVLSIMDTGSYVPAVGYNLGGGMFYVSR